MNSITQRVTKAYSGTESVINPSLYALIVDKRSAPVVINVSVRKHARKRVKEKIRRVNPHTPPPLPAAPQLASPLQVQKAASLVLKRRAAIPVVKNTIL